MYVVFASRSNVEEINSDIQLYLHDAIFRIAMERVDCCQLFFLITGARNRKSQKLVEYGAME